MNYLNIYRRFKTERARSSRDDKDISDILDQVCAAAVQLRKISSIYGPGAGDLLRDAAIARVYGNANKERDSMKKLSKLMTDAANTMRAAEEQTDHDMVEMFIAQLEQEEVRGD